MKRKYARLSLRFMTVLEFFKSFGEPVFCEESSDYLLYKITNKDNREELERMILSTAYIDNCRLPADDKNFISYLTSVNTILSSTKKPLYLVFKLNACAENTFAFEVKQLSAKGYIFNIFETLSSLPEELKMLDFYRKSISYKKELDSIESSISNEKTKFEFDYIYLSYEDLKSLNRKKKLSKIEKYQVLKTYEEAKSSYDQNPEMIDDNKQMQAVIESNLLIDKKIKYIKKIALKYDIEI